MTVLVTGATGFIGTHLTRRLLERGESVRILARSPAKAADLESQGAQVHIGDLTDPRALQTAVQGCKTCYHVGAALGGGAMTQYLATVQATRDLARFAAAAGVSRFVHVSSIAVYGADVHGVIREDHRQNPPRDDYYMQAKHKAEADLWQIAANTGMPTTSIRPAFVYGVGSGFWSLQLYRVIRQYGLPLFGRSGNAHPIHVDDIVDLTLTLAEHPAAVGEAFNCAPDPAVSWETFLSYYARYSGNSRRLALPTTPIRWIAPTFALASRWTGNPINAPGYLNFLTSDATYSMEKAHRLLGWKARVTLDEGMARTEAWLKSQR